MVLNAYLEAPVGWVAWRNWEQSWKPLQWLVCGLWFQLVILQIQSRDVYH